jgi:outer membrane protein TolC
MVLAQYIGVNGTDIQIDTTLASRLPDPKTYLVDHQAALDNRTEAQLLDKNVEANHLQTRLKKGELLPTVAVGAAGVYQDLSGDGTGKRAGNGHRERADKQSVEQQPCREASAHRRADGAAGPRRQSPTAAHSDAECI